MIRVFRICTARRQKSCGMYNLRQALCKFMYFGHLCPHKRPCFSLPWRHSFFSEEWFLHCQQRLTQVLHLGKHSDRVEPNAQHSRQCHCNPIEEDTSRLVVPSETNNVWQGGIMLILFYHGVQVCQQALNVSPQWNSVNLEFFPIISQKEQTKAAISCPLGCHVA